MHSDQPEAQAHSAQVLYLGPDGALARRLGPQLARRGIALLAGADAADPTRRGDCAAIVVDTALLRPGRSIADLVAEQRPPGSAGPVLVVLAHTKAIELRLAALRAGAAACFAPPVASGPLAERIAELCRPRRAETGRVLVVEDSAMQAILAERVLTGGGFSVRVLTEPLKILETMEDYRPDLILMDLHMPQADGGELAAIVRDHDEFAAIPILLHSVERDLERQAQALAMGADAFIPKPIRAELLVAAVARRIAAARILRQRIAVAEHVDPDTGLASRHHFMAVLERTLAEPGIADEPGVALLAVALDGVSRIRDLVGTGGTDLVQDRLGRLIQGRLGPSDLAARLDNHRHLLLVRRPADDALCTYAEELRLAIAGYPIAVAGKTVAVTASIGIGFFRPLAPDPIALIARAETACGEALGAGGDRVAAHLPRGEGLVDEAYEGRISALVAAALGRGPGPGGFRLVYQPLVAVQSQSRKYAEVLICLDDPEGGALAPALLLPIAERSGQILALDRWLMLRSLAVLKEHHGDQPKLRLIVRQHLESLTSPHWVQWLRDQLVAHGVADRRPVVELAAADLLKHRQLAPMPLKQLRKLGIKTAIAEVDQTPAALDLVTDLQPQFVKLALAVTAKIEQQALLRLVDRLRRTGAEVVVAGIDQPDQIAPVWASGVSYAQGAMIQEPLTDPVFD